MVSTGCQAGVSKKFTISSDPLLETKAEHKRARRRHTYKRFQEKILRALKVTHKINNWGDGGGGTFLYHEWRPPTWGNATVSATLSDGGDDSLTEKRLDGPSIVRKQSLGIGQDSAFDASWGTAETGGGLPRAVPLSAGTRQSDKRS